MFKIHAKAYRVIACLIALACSAAAQAADQAVLRIVVPFPAGGVTDQTARIVAAQMAKELGRTVIVDNRPGAGSRLGTDAVFKAPPDGNTLLFTNSSFSILPVIDPNAAWQRPNSFVPLSMTASYGLQVVVSKQVPVKTLPEFIAYARQRPGKLSYGSSGIGSGSHFAGEYFKSLTGTFLVHIPYKSTVDAVRDVAGGAVDLAFDAAAKPAIDAGRVTLLAVTSDRRDPRFPATPTAAEAGLKPFVLTSWVGLLAPPGLPDDIAAALNRAADLSRADTSVQKRLEEAGLQAQGGAPSKLAAMIKDEAKLYRRIADDARLKFE